jgi:hypothetical protein
MTKQEFTQRTGYTPATEEEWKAIEMMYLEAGESIQKDLFCKEWLEHKDSNLLRIFYKRAMDNVDKLEYFNDMRTKTAHLLIMKSAEHEDIDLYMEAVKLIGQKRVILYKIEKGIKLYGSDLEYITDNLQ